MSLDSQFAAASDAPDPPPKAHQRPSFAAAVLAVMAARRLQPTSTEERPACESLTAIVPSGTTPAFEKQERAWWGEKRIVSTDD